MVSAGAFGNVEYPYTQTWNAITLQGPIDESATTVWHLIYEQTNDMLN